MEFYLSQARALLAACEHAGTESEASVNTEFDHLRWFDLPSSCLPVVPSIPDDFRKIASAH